MSGLAERLEGEQVCPGRPGARTTARRSPGHVFPSQTSRPGSWPTLTQSPTGFGELGP